MNEKHITSVRATLPVYLRAMIDQFAAFATGGVVAAIVSISIGAFAVQVPSWAHAAIFIWGGIVVAGYWAWRELYRRSLELEEKIESQRRELEAQRDELKETRKALDAKPAPPVGPRLSLRFDPADRKCKARSSGDDLFRVQVINDGDARAEDVSVVLVGIDPPNPAWLGRHFTLAESDKTSFAVSPAGEGPAEYVDLFLQRHHAEYGHVQNLRLKDTTPLLGPESLKLTLGIKGPGRTKPLEVTFIAGERKRLQPRVANGLTGPPSGRSAP